MGYANLEVGNSPFLNLCQLLHTTSRSHFLALKQNGILFCLQTTSTTFFETGTIIHFDCTTSYGYGRRRNAFIVQPFHIAPKTLWRVFKGSDIEGKTGFYQVRAQRDQCELIDDVVLDSADYSLARNLVDER